MLKYVKKSVFNNNTEAIVNTINCEGFMGKGIALEFALRYPSLLNSYKEKCKNNEINIGKIFYYQTKNLLIVNFPTKDKFRFSSKYEWIEQGLTDFVNTYKYYNIKTISFPPLGCGCGNLNFNIVKGIMEKHLSKLNDLDIYICLDPKYAEGKELEMIKCFNNTTYNDFLYKIKIPKKQVNILLTHQNQINRFYELNTIDGIGNETYKKLYNYFYTFDNTFIQGTLF